MESQQALMNRFKAFYLDIKQVPLADIGELYANDVIFKDPVQEVRGIEKLHAYMSDLCLSVQSGRFEYLDQQVSENKAYIKWNMHFKHPKLGNQTLTVRGMSQIEFHDRIYYHEDVYDLGSMLYEHIPLLGRAVKGLKKRLAMPS
ncbi:SnoaL-like domain protein [Marinomonas spartinae]|uniref:nuclear transport factor 2 family protein n=1 Tax=Marinomonas spartinae TaxID=1792290 RepID=UPI000809015D|nr:nuclear transport factor 2 family protein [Marinomonas spartinae]SBS39125.1 SnoaL-like domain protein [Marinomonas spartinae]